MLKCRTFITLFGLALVIWVVIFATKVVITPPIHGTLRDIITGQPISGVEITISPGTLTPGFLDPSFRLSSHRKYITDESGNFYAPRRLCLISPTIFSTRYVGCIFRIKSDSYWDDPVIEISGKSGSYWYSSPITERLGRSVDDVSIHLYPKVDDTLSFIDQLLDCIQNKTVSEFCASIKSENITKYHIFDGLCRRTGKGNQGYYECLMHYYTQTKNEKACNQLPIAVWDNGRCRMK